jgi:hypothetical protein
VSTSPELESRVERLEATLAEIDARLAKLEHRRSSGGQAILPVQQKSERNLLAVAGICSLILGGAFVLRALTESHMLPPLAGAILGLAYAAFWIWRADRYYAITAAIIAFPLVWETTVRFHIITPIVASILIAAFGLLFLRKDPVLAWVGSVGAIAAAFAIGPSVAMLIAISVIGLFATKYEYVSWAPAIAANIIAPILIVTKPPGTPIALIAYAALWMGLPVQSSIAALIGGGGATYLMLPNLMALAAAWAVIGVAAAEIARRTSSRTIAVQSVVWIVAAAVLTPYAGLAAIASFFLLRWREERVVLLMVFLYMLFMGIHSIVNAPLIHTIILVSSACLLALIPMWETRVVARVLLVAAGLQIVIEDLRLGNAAMLVIAFALYGAALIIVSKLLRRDIRKLAVGKLGS